MFLDMTAPPVREWCCVRPTGNTPVAPAPLLLFCGRVLDVWAVPEPDGLRDDPRQSVADTPEPQQPEPQTLKWAIPCAGCSRRWRADCPAKYTPCFYSSWIDSSIC